MDLLKKLALGCAIGGALCANAQAELIDSAKAGSKAYLLSDTHLYRYESGSSSVELNLELAGNPVGLAVTDDAIFVAYDSKIEKRTLDGAPVSDPVSGGDLTRNFVNVLDVAVHGSSVFVLFLDGEAVHELNQSDLSPAAGPSAPYSSLSSKIQRLEPYSSGGLTFYSPDGKDLAMLPWPGTPDISGKTPVMVSDIDQEDAGLVATPEKMFIMDGAGEPQILMDNGTGWSLEGTHTIGWVAGKDLRFADAAEDGTWSVIRDRITACETGDALNWSSDLVHYDEFGGFSSRYKAGDGTQDYEVLYLWGADPVAHMFREAGPGVLLADSVVRTAGTDFTDGKQPFSIAADQPLSAFQISQGVSRNQIALADDASKAYVLHLGSGACEAAVRVYDLQNDSWIDTIPLRWRPEAIATVGGANPDSSDDMLAVVYETAYNAYGRSDILASFIDINAVSPAEDPSTDFREYNVLHSNVGNVQGSRYAVLFQVEKKGAGSLITAWSPERTKAVYQDCLTGETCDDGRKINQWDARVPLGESAGMILKVEDEIRFLQFSEDALTFTLDAPYAVHTLLDSTVSNSEELLLLSPDQELFTLNLGTLTALFRRNSQAFSEGKASDFLPVPTSVATWSETTQGADDRFALYTLNGGDVEGTTPAEVQRWVMALGNDGHFEFDTSDSAELPGKPVLVSVVDPVTDDLLIATVYLDQILFTPINKALTDGPGFEPQEGGGDGNGSGDGGDSGSGSGGSNDNSSASGSGFSSGGGGGGGSLAWFSLLMLLVVGRFRKAGTK